MRDFVMMVTQNRPAPARALILAIAVAITAALGAALGMLSAMAVVPLGDSAPAALLGIPAAVLFAVGTLAYPLLGVVGALFTFPYGVASVPVGFVGLQLVEAAVLVVAALVALRRLALGQTMLPWAPGLWWFLALIAWTVVALPSAVDQELAVKQIAQLLGGLLFALTIMASTNDLQGVRKVLVAFAVVATVVSVVAIAGGRQLEIAYEGTTVHGRAEGTFDQPNQLGSFLALGALTTVGLALGTSTRLRSVLLSSCVAIMVGALLLSLSRGAWIGTVLATAFLVLTLKEGRRWLLMVGLPLLVGAVLLGAFAPGNPQLQVVGKRFESLTVRSPYDNRPAIWNEAWREVIQDPWTGQGPGTFPVSSARAVSEATTVSADHAHNLWLTWAAESGVPAALLITAFVVALGMSARRALRAARRRADRAMVLGMSAGLLALLGQGVVDYTFRNAVVFFSLWTVAGALLAAGRVYGDYPGITPASTTDHRQRDTSPISPSEAST